MTLRLHLNENTAGCSPAVLEALRAMTAADVATYADYGAVTDDYARACGVPAEYVQLTNGLDDGLQAVAVTVARERAGRAGGVGFNALIAEPAFEMYAANVASAGGRIVRIPPGPDLEFPLAAVVAAAERDIDLAFVCDPGNPAGLPLPADAVERLADAAPCALVFVDEAYAEFSGRTAIGLVAGRRNVVIGRSFSKAYGLAGIRAGALVGHPDTLARVRRSIQPFTLNACAVRAVRAALSDRAHLDRYLIEVQASRRRLEDFCRRQELRFWPSEANFVLMRVGDAPALTAALAADGILIRDRSALPGCDGCVRITAGVEADTLRCIAAMEAYFAARPR